MDLKERSRKQLIDRIEKLENVIANKGVGSSYLNNAKRIQRDVNIALMLGTATALLGITAWKLFKSNK